MSDQNPEPKSWGSSIVIGIILLVLAIGIIFFVYYIFIQTTIPPYPVSPFKFGDVIQISPAILTRDNYSTTSANQNNNQFLVKNTCVNYPCDGCYRPVGANDASCVATFSGKKQDPATKWVLEQLPYTGNEYPAQQADQNVLAFGNRFYLRNSLNTTNDPAGRLLFSLFDSTSQAPSCSGLSPDKSFPITTLYPKSCPTCPGCYDPDTAENRGNELVLYFWPTSQPDLYYILLPGSLNNIDLRTKNDSVTSQTNNGVVTLRPYAPSNPGDTTYNPFMDDGNLYNNGMLLNSQSSYPIGVKYPRPEVFLFKITKA